VKSTLPLDILQIPTPSELYATLIHPQIEIKTSDAREILPKQVSLKDATAQWANVGSLIHALHTSDYKLIHRSLQDIIVEPHRKQLIPYFDDVKFAALEAGALGCAISGSGPSIFALSQSKETALKVENAMQMVYSKTSIEFNTFVSDINIQGIKILKS
jgi:homoserine kinase